MGLGNGNSKAADKGSNHNFEHRHLISLGQIQSAAAAGALEATLSSLNTKFTAVVRVATALRVAGVANTTVAAGARSIAFFNAGPVAATVAGAVLNPGEAISFAAGGEEDTLGSIAYITIATGDLLITTVV